MANMSRSALELYLYMCSYEEIIKWLEEEDCKTVQDALNKLEPLVGSNIRGWAMSIGAGERGASLAGTNNCVKHVMEHFKKKEENGKEKVK